MPHYPKYTMVAIGAYSVPRWYESLDVSRWELLPADMAGAQFRTMQASILSSRKQASM